MILFEFENPSPFLNSLGWTLLHFLWQGTLIAILTRVTMILLRKCESNVRYLVMCAALLLMLLAPVMTFTLIHNRGEHFLAVDETRFLGSDFQISPGNNSGGNSTVAQTFQHGSGGTDENEQLFGSPILINFEASFPWLVSLWFAGVSILSLRLMIDWLSVRRLKQCAAERLIEWQPTVQRLGERLGINKSVQLLESSLVKVPVAVGWLKPVVLLPAGMILGLTQQQLEGIIAHELAHIRRHDYLVNIFQAIAEILLFYHPAVLWLSKQIRNEREYACDDLAIAACGGDALCYARALAKVERIRKAAPLLANAATGGSLENRVRRLVDASYRQPAVGGVSGCLIFLTIFALIAFGWQTTSSGKSTNQLDRDSVVISSEITEKIQREDKLIAAKSSTSSDFEAFPGEDANLREIALSALNGRQGSVIVMNPHTGRLYTIVNQDLAFRKEWFPASTFKIITSVAALNENKVKADEKISVSGFTNGLTLNEAVAISQNDFFERLGERVGADKLIAYARRFGLGRRTGVNLPGEIAGNLPRKGSQVDAGLLAKYGQDVKATPLQLAVMISALANKGLLVRPFASQPENPPHYLPKLMASRESVLQIVGGMRTAVEKGTGKGAFNASFTVAGKTGTAETDDAATGLFASFAPLDNPRFVVVVAVKEPKANGLMAAEIAGKIYRFLGDGSYRLEN
ncbi:MAG: penicillin-binding transpeptidase domain-containing protein [Acidobacteriota bacterium]|nr:penicillin-binding transpeptidase domain-containing protein [Acidobacteriota bacterium]